MTYSVVIVLHDSAAHLRRLLASLDTQLPERPQVICVDSGSHDDGVAVAREWGAQTLVLDGNQGFGAANNAGIALATHPVSVLLNPDCLARDAGLARLAALAGERRALVVPRLLNPDGSVQRSAHPLPGSRDAYLAALVPPRVLPRRPREHLEPFRASSPRTVGWAIAACVAARTDLLRGLGPFDAEHFLFYEDLDLCLRAAATGIPTELHPQIALTHVGGHSTRAAFADEALELQARRRRTVIARALGAHALARDDRAQALTFGLRAAAGRDRARNRAQLAALRAAQKSPSWDSGGATG